MKAALLVVVLCVFAAALHGQKQTVTVPLGSYTGEKVLDLNESDKTECHKLGDKVTVRGRARGVINGGTYFEPLKPFCVDFPATVYKGERITPLHLTTVRQKVQPDIYVDLTGVLRDAYPEYGIAIEVESVRNVDAEVKAEIAESKKKCEQWRQENIPPLENKMHGGKVYPYEANADVFTTPQCGLMGVDAISHEVVTVWMLDSASSIKRKESGTQK